MKMLNQARYTWPSGFVSNFQPSYGTIPRYGAMPQYGTNPNLASTDHANEITVDFVSLEEVPLNDAILSLNGLQSNYRVKSGDDKALWDILEARKDELESLIRDTVKSMSTGRLVVREIKHQEGSIEILVLLGVATAWFVANAGGIGTVCAMIGLYNPIKSLIKDVKRIIPTLQNRIEEFFQSIKRTFGFLPPKKNSGFTNLSSMPCSDLGCWVYYENTLPSPPGSEHRPRVPDCGCGT